jgi:hypothetical protein
MTDKRRLLIVVVGLSLVAMACTCGPLAGLQRAQEAAEQLQQAEQMATQFAEEVDVEEFSTQAAEMATQMGEGGFEEMSTQAAEMATQMGEGGFEGLATQMAEGGFGSMFWNPPSDVPIYPGAQEAFGAFASEDAITFTVEAPFQDVVDFYVEGMADNGWEPSEGDLVSGYGDVFEDDTAIFYVEKDGGDRQAAITITDQGDGKTFVQIVIATR